MLNPALDIEQWSSILAAEGRVQVLDVLQGEAAEALEHCLEQDVPWTLALRCGGESKKIPPESYQELDAESRTALVAEAAAEAGRGFAFAYESYHMITAYLEQRNPDLLLHRLVEFLNGPQFLHFARRLANDERIIKADCQATCYRAGHFLTLHDDTYEQEGRLYAFVLSLTRRWRGDWGGLLHFADADGQVTGTLMPRFNALSVFKVPVNHFVSMVAPFAGAPRYSITGWFRSS